MEEQRKPQFPPQTQPQQPGKEYVMCPLPLAINPDYKPSEKLNVRALLHSLKHMKEGSSIINTTSVTAYAGSPHQLLDYLSTKGSIVSFTRGLALRLVDKGIRVNGVAPGPIWTPLQPASLPAYEVEYLGSDVPMGRAGQPYEMAPSYVFLASNQCSSYMTGQVLHPNVGNSFRRRAARQRACDASNPTSHKPSNKLHIKEFVSMQWPRVQSGPRCSLHASMPGERVERLGSEVPMGRAARSLVRLRLLTSSWHVITALPISLARFCILMLLLGGDCQWFISQCMGSLGLFSCRTRLIAGSLYNCIGRKPTGTWFLHSTSLASYAFLDDKFKQSQATRSMRHGINDLSVKRGEKNKAQIHMF
ncbi:hypothetical protein D5086_016748 [Populus alba]|uniref:Uncharacterized protein n=1 Tax=Populus alba TaxID=43335 RepID=A0ACC4BVJ7_POPAL